MDDDQSRKGLLKKLSNRERQAAELRAKGISVEHIAREMGVTAHTVKTYLSRANDKLHIDDPDPGQRLLALERIFRTELGSSALPPGREEVTEIQEPVAGADTRLAEKQPTGEGEASNIPSGQTSAPLPQRGNRTFSQGMTIGAIIGVIVTVVILFSLTRLRLISPNPFVGNIPTFTSSPLLGTTLPTNQPVASPASTSIPIFPHPPTGATQTSGPTQVILPPMPTEISNPRVLFQNDFRAGLDPRWQVIEGDPKIINGGLTADLDTWLFVGGPDWTNYEINLEAESPRCSFNAAGSVIGVRATDMQNMIPWRWTACEGAWYDLEGGNWALNFDTLMEPGHGRKTFRIVARGNQFWVSLGELVLAFQSTEKFPQGKVALRLNKETIIYSIRVTTIQ